MSKKENQTPSSKKKVQKQKKTTKILSVPVRLELKPDGRVVWDVAEVHKAIAKQCANNPSFADSKMLVKKDASSLQLAQFVKTEETQPVQDSEQPEKTGTDEKSEAESE